MTLLTKTLDGSDVTLSQKDIDELISQLSGELILPGGAGYDDARTIWNAMIDRRPSLIACCLGVADVVACINFARERSLLVTIKGGGHNIAGLSVSDGGMLLDMSLMRGVWVDTASRIARAQTGCLLGDVDRETQIHGLAAILGFVSKTGIAGLTLGGGFGYLTRKYGWTSDNVTAMEMVAADGQVVRASEGENSDLFWGLRGGGGNFGVVTGIEYKLHPVGPQVMAGAIAWRAEDAEAVLDMYREVTKQASRELTCVAGLRIAPPAPWLRADMYGKPIVILFVIHSGTVEEGAAAVAPIKAFGQPVGDVIQPRPYISQQTILDATQPKGRRYYWKSEYLPELDPRILPKVIEHAGRILSPHSAILLFPLEGRLNELPEDHSAVGNRDAAFVLNITSSWEDALDDHANITWARDAWQDMRCFSTGGTYVNFLTEDEGDDRTHSAYKDNYQRLVEIKTQWDPGNMFRVNKNIAP